MEDIVKIINESFSINDVSMKLFGYTNGVSIKKIKKILIDNNIDISIFKSKNKNQKYQIIKKICPICKLEFETKIGSKKETTTCSNKCANLYFQHGHNNNNFDKVKYKERYAKVSKT